jgi:hypothetical protein
MTVEVFKDEWKKFFDKISRELYQWHTSIEVINPKSGRQTLTNKLSFVGITAETNQNGQNQIDLIIGESANAHQTHIIRNPLKVSYLESEKLPGRLIAIESDGGIKTLVNLQKPPVKRTAFSDCQVPSITYWKIQNLL